jgi:hypothetical protein
MGDGSRRFVRQLDSSDLEGIFPPRWKKGDEWRVSYLVHEYDGEVNDPRDSWLPTTAHFRVASLPSYELDAYVIEVRHSPDRDTEPFYVFTVRRQDFSVARLDGDGAHFDHGAHPFPNFWDSVERFPLVFPSVAPERAEMYYFSEPEQDMVGVAEDGWQRIRTQHGDAVEFELVSRARHRFDTLRVFIEWRRGEPWWSSAKCWSVRGHDPPLVPFTVSAVCDAKLVRDPAPTQTK